MKKFLPSASVMITPNKNECNELESAGGMICSPGAIVPLAKLCFPGAAGDHQRYAKILAQAPCRCTGGLGEGRL
jgi:hypothetical protein